MAEKKTMNIAELRGKTVLSSSTGEKLGEVWDLMVNPAEGRVLALVVDVPGGEKRAVATSDFVIGADAVMTTGPECFLTPDQRDRIEGGLFAVDRLVGAKVVTEGGNLVGKVTEVHASLEAPRIAYRIAESTLQSFLGGGGFYISGTLPVAISPDGERMIVSSEIEHGGARSTAAEALGV